MQFDIMTLADFLGWVAVLFTLVAFSMRTMFPLRVSAICANVFFMAYAHLEGTFPILALHAILLPFNAGRLRQIICERRATKRKEQSSIQIPYQFDVAANLKVPADKIEAVVVFRLWDGKPLRRFE